MFLIYEIIMKIVDTLYLTWLMVRRLATKMCNSPTQPTLHEQNPIGLSRWLESPPRPIRDYIRALNVEAEDSQTSGLDGDSASEKDQMTQTQDIMAIFLVAAHATNVGTQTVWFKERKKNLMRVNEKKALRAHSFN